MAKLTVSAADDNAAYRVLFTETIANVPHAQTQVAPFVYGDRVQLGDAAAGRRAKGRGGREISCAVDHHEYRTVALLGSWASGLFSRIPTHVQAALGPLISVDRRGSSLPSPKVDRSLLSRLGDDEWRVQWMPSIRCKLGRVRMPGM